MWMFFKLHFQKAAAILLLFLVAVNLIIWTSVLEKEKQPDLRVSFLDVGQGDAAFIESRDGTQILIDGGPNSQILSKLAQILPYYDRSIDVVVLTHPHADHVAGLNDVLKRYNVEMVVESGVLYHTSEAKEFVRLVENLVEKKNLKRIIIDSPTVLSFFDGVKLEFIHPTSSYENRGLKRVHDAVLVSKLSFQDKEFLFMGDAEKRVEKELVKGGLVDDVDVLKVGHHGSKTSSTGEFLIVTKPEYTIVQVGRNEKIKIV